MDDRRPTSSKTLLRAVIMLAASILVLTALTTVTIVRLVDQAASQSQIEHVERLQAQQILESCHRENVLRQEDNASHYADFVVDSFVEKRFSKPTPTETAAQRRVTAEFADRLNRAIAEKSWTPVTNCARAVNTRGVAYRAPAPIPFQRQLPPPSALLTPR